MVFYFDRGLTTEFQVSTKDNNDAFNLFKDFPKPLLFTTFQNIINLTLILE